MRQHFLNPPSGVLSATRDRCNRCCTVANRFPDARSIEMNHARNIVGRLRFVPNSYSHAARAERRGFVPSSYRRVVRLTGLLVAGLSAATIPAGCVRANKEAAASRTGGIRLAVGAVHPITITDACPSGGKGNLCSTEKVTKINSVTSSDTRMAEVLPISAVPSEMREGNVEYVVQGRTPGKAGVRIEATFDDGSVRSDTIDVNIVAVDSVEPAVQCPSGASDAQKLFPPGQSVLVSLRLLGAGGELKGAVPGALTGTGLHQTTGLTSTRYQWIAPASPGAVTVTTRGLPPMQFTLESYAPDSIEIGALKLKVPSPDGVTLGQITPLDIALTVRGQKPCVYPGLDVTTRSPTVCSGPAGETAWREIGEAWVRIKPIAAGICQLTVTASGASKGTDVQIEYRAKP